jgi:hypothetical protein
MQIANYIVALMPTTSLLILFLVLQDSGFCVDFLRPYDVGTLFLQ